MGAYTAKWEMHSGNTRTIEYKPGMIQIIAFTMMMFSLLNFLNFNSNTCILPSEIVYWKDRKIMLHYESWQYLMTFNSNVIKHIKKLFKSYTL